MIETKQIKSDGRKEVIFINPKLVWCYVGVLAEQATDENPAVYHTRLFGGSINLVIDMSPKDFAKHVK